MRKLGVIGRNIIIEKKAVVTNISFSVPQFLCMITFLNQTEDFQLLITLLDFFSPANSKYAVEPNCTHRIPRDNNKCS